MAKGNKIVLAPDPQGIKLEGTISGTPSPGTVMEVVPATAFTNGRPSYRVFQRGTDGQRTTQIVCIPNPLNGMTATTAYANGDHGFFYVPQEGEELNMLVKDAAGTASFTIGEFFIHQNATGVLVPTTGSPQCEPYMCMELLTGSGTAALAYVQYTGY